MINHLIEINNLILFNNIICNLISLHNKLKVSEYILGSITNTDIRKKNLENN